VDVRKRATEVRRRVASAGDASRVRIVAVTKGFGADAVDAALRAGITDIGESYAQELLAKAPAVAREGARWHFIGRLQTNKVRAIGELVDLWQSIDRATLGDEVAKRVPGAKVLLQVNVTNETQKGGCGPAEVPQLVRRLQQSGLDVQGLMTVGRAGTAAEVRPGFQLLRRLADDLGLPECSMGMSDDLEVAVEEGSTIVRVGRALFGERPRSDPAQPAN
jgi:pyridoxal phosphate enzyme (YggS family)